MRNKKGFTLIEVIVTIIIVAIVGTMLVAFTGNAVIDSVTPLLRVQNANVIGQVFENITADYNRLNAQDVSDNSSVALSTLQSRINNGHNQSSTHFYGSYSVVDNAYIAFDNNGNQINGSSDDRILKVTLRSGDQTITTLFAK